MRSFITLGVLSLVGASALMACGDDDSPSPIGQGGGGSGGRAGAGGAGGATGGTAGRPGGGGGAGGVGGATGPAVSCTGCVELDLPFTAAAQNALYQFGYPAPGLDFSNAVITWSVQVLTPNAGLFVHPQVQNGPRPQSDGSTGYPGYFAGPTTPLTAANFPAGQWTNVVLDLSTVPGVGGAADAGADGGEAADAGLPLVAPFDKSAIEALQLQVGATAAGTGLATVLIDSVTITGVPGTTGATFTAGLEGLTLNNYAGSPTPPGTPAPVPH